MVLPVGNPVRMPVGSSATWYQIDASVPRIAGSWRAGFPDHLDRRLHGALAYATGVRASNNVLERHGERKVNALASKCDVKPAGKTDLCTGMLLHRHADAETGRLDRFPILAGLVPRTRREPQAGVRRIESV